MIFETFTQDSSVVIGLVAATFIFCFTVGFGTGANDLANSFSSPYGAKTLTVLQIIIVASIFELLGAIIVGLHVADTLKGGIVNGSFIIESYKHSMDCVAPTWYGNNNQLINYTLNNGALYNESSLRYGCPEIISMTGSVAVLVGTSMWIAIATLFRMPISSSHSVVGGLLGYGLVALRGQGGIQWVKIGLIVASWFLSPISAGIVASIIYLILDYGILRRKNPFDLAIKFIPLIYFLSIFLVTFAIVYEGPSMLYFDRIPLWGVFVTSIGLGLVVTVIIWLFVNPYLKRKLLHIEPNQEEEINRNHIAKSQNELENANPSSRQFNETVTSSQIELTSSDADNYTQVVNEDKRVQYLFKPLQIMSSCYMSFSHGGNDVGNAVGQLINVWLIYKENKIVTETLPPIWILIYGGLSFVVGLAVWGKPVLKRLGSDIITITPITGYSIEFATVLTVLLMSKFGLPISTTHCVTGAIVAIGITKFGIRSLNPKLMVSIALTWFVTVPISALLSAFIFFSIQSIIFGI